MLLEVCNWPTLERGNCYFHIESCASHTKKYATSEGKAKERKVSAFVAE